MTKLPCIKPHLLKGHHLSTSPPWWPSFITWALWGETTFKPSYVTSKQMFNPVCSCQCWSLSRFPGSCLPNNPSSLPSSKKGDNFHFIQLYFLILKAWQRQFSCPPHLCLKSEVSLLFLWCNRKWVSLILWIFKTNLHYMKVPPPFPYVDYRQ
jgi:hypothetical protein